jgi:superfamily II DNA or RNA helicase
VLGLSATPYRADGLTKLISFFIGEALYRIEPKTLQDQGAIMTARLIIRKTAFNFPYYHPEDYQPMLTGLTIDHNRNLLIVGDVLEASKNGAGISLILSDRKAHCRDLADMIQGHRETRLLTGDMKAEDRKQVVEELKKGKVKVLIATAQLIGEGFDLPALSNLFLTTPVKFEGRTKQYVGRILRTAQGKECPVVFDYLDRPGVLQVGFRARMKAYKEMGIELRKE